MYGLAGPAHPLGGAIDRKNTGFKKRLRALLADIEPCGPLGVVVGGGMAAGERVTPKSKRSVRGVGIVGGGLYDPNRRSMIGVGWERWGYYHRGLMR